MALILPVVHYDLLEGLINEVDAIAAHRQPPFNFYLIDATLLLRYGLQGTGSAEVVLSFSTMVSRRKQSTSACCYPPIAS